MSACGGGQDQETRHQVSAWLQRPERSGKSHQCPCSRRYMLLVIPDLQLIERRDRREGRGEGRAQDHRDQRAERGGRPSREDSQSPGHQCGRGSS